MDKRAQYYSVWRACATLSLTLVWSFRFHFYICFISVIEVSSRKFPLLYAEAQRTISLPWAREDVTPLSMEGFWQTNATKMSRMSRIWKQECLFCCSFKLRGCIPVLASIMCLQRRKQRQVPGNQELTASVFALAWRDTCKPFVVGSQRSSVVTSRDTAWPRLSIFRAVGSHSACCFQFGPFIFPYQRFFFYSSVEQVQWACSVVTSYFL